jgi:Cdc6-like AAA superfamily ATPase
MVEDPKKGLTDIEYMMCCNTTTGFALTQKLWLLDLHINQLSKIKFKPNPFNALQLPAYKKQYVRRLLEGFRKGKNSVEAYDDVIEGKGQGLIFLLYGPPGLGKTLTAGKSH